MEIQDIYEPCTYQEKCSTLNVAVTFCQIKYVHLCVFQLIGFLQHAPPPALPVCSHWADAR